MLAVSVVRFKSAWVDELGDGFIKVRQRRGLFVCNIKNEMRTKEEGSKGVEFFELFIPLHCQALTR